jgi:hypothetical protein
MLDRSRGFLAMQSFFLFGVKAHREQAENRGKPGLKNSFVCILEYDGAASSRGSQSLVGRAAAGLALFRLMKFEAKKPRLPAPMTSRPVRRLWSATIHLSRECLVKKVREFQWRPWGLLCHIKSSLRDRNLRLIVQANIAYRTDKRHGSLLPSFVAKVLSILLAVGRLLAHGVHGFLVKGIVRVFGNESAVRLHRGNATLLGKV